MNCRKVYSLAMMSVTAPDFQKFAMNNCIDTQLNNDKEMTNAYIARGRFCFARYMNDAMYLDGDEEKDAPSIGGIRRTPNVYFVRQKTK